MKIAFDEHVPAGMVRVFKALAPERSMRKPLGSNTSSYRKGYEIVSARAYTSADLEPEFTDCSDVPWLRRFARDGGKVVISGDVEMMRVPQEALALQQEGLIAFFFEPSWNNGDFFRKSSIMLWFWTSIIHAVKSAKPGDIYRIPATHLQKAGLTRVLRQGQLEMLVELPPVQPLATKRRSQRIRGAREDTLKQPRLNLALRDQ